MAGISLVMTLDLNKIARFAPLAPPDAANPFAGVADTIRAVLVTKPADASDTDVLAMIVHVCRDVLNDRIEVPALKIYAKNTLDMLSGFAESCRGIGLGFNPMPSTLKVELTDDNVLTLTSEEIFLDRALALLDNDGDKIHALGDSVALRETADVGC